MACSEPMETQPVGFFLGISITTTTTTITTTWLAAAWWCLDDLYEKLRSRNVVLTCLAIWYVLLPIELYRLKMNRSEPFHFFICSYLLATPHTYYMEWVDIMFLATDQRMGQARIIITFLDVRPPVCLSIWLYEYVRVRGCSCCSCVAFFINVEIYSNNTSCALANV